MKLTSIGAISWQKAYGGVKADYCAMIQQTSDGGYIAVGSSETYCSSSSPDVWLIKLNEDGGVNWQRRYGTNGSDLGIRVTQTVDGGYIIGGFSNDGPLVLRLATDGSVTWQKKYILPSAFPHVSSIMQTADNGYIAALEGRFSVLKLDTNGTVTWCKSYFETVYHESYANCIFSVQQTVDAGYIATGRFFYNAGLIKLDSIGNASWLMTYDCNNTINSALETRQTSDGGYITSIELWKGSCMDLGLLKTSATGQIQWQ